MRKAYLSLLFIVLFQSAFSIDDVSTDRTKYIERWKDVAMKQMKLHGIPASITLAQGILESRNGQSELTQKSNNHFGIKCHSWKGKKVYADDDKKNECFRKYKNANQSFEDHSQFLLRKRYASLFELKKSDYKGWARGLRKAGYATDPAYAKLLIKLIEQNELTQYDKKVLKGKYIESPDSVEEIVMDSSKPEKPKKAINLETTSVINLVYYYDVKQHSNNIK
jgi:flagellum-specific peptidoglycan hydrolase FlgJ